MRNLTTGMQSQIAATFLRPCVFVYAEFQTGPIYLWSGLGPISWNGQVWTGVGTLGSISPIQETSEVSATNVAISLSGIPSDLLGDAMLEIRQGKQVRIWIGALDAANAIIADPFESFSGRMDISEISEGPETSTITLTIENALVDMQRSHEVPFTDQGQQSIFPGDKGFQYVPQLQDKSITWGRNKV